MGALFLLLGLFIFFGLVPVEYERCQGLPDGFTDAGVSQTARYNALGNGWTAPVIEWFFKGLT